MTDVNVSLPPALRQALDLLADAPADPDVSKGYLDLLGSESTPEDAVRKNVGRVQWWTSPIGSMLYDNAQALLRRRFTAWRPPVEWLNIPAGGTALDVGSGPGNVTALLGRAAGPDGLALGVEISEPMLARAVRDQAGPQVGFIRADAQRLPLRDNTVDAVVSIAVLQLVPNPPAAVAEMVRVLRPGGRLALLVPSVGRATRRLPKVGAQVGFGNDEIAGYLKHNGIVSVGVKNFGTFQWVRGTNE
jgi:arsenite methyltransferase